MTYYSSLFVSLVLTLASIPLLTKLALRFRLMDVPDARKTHTIPVPRCGGLAMAFGALTPTAYWFFDNPFILAFLAAATCIVFFGTADDFFGLSPRWKFLGQVVAALIMITWGGVRIENLGALLPDGVLLPLGLSVPLTLITLVGVTNAVNLVDGLDGLAGGISLLNICFVGYLAVISGNATIAVASLAIAGAIFGFLRFNTHPASIFMGDSGSQMLGFATVCFAVLLSQASDAISPCIPLLLFGLPVFDTLSVMTNRIIAGRSPFSPDRGHFHHRLLEIGFGHAEAVVIIYLLQALLVLAAFFLRFQSSWLILGVYAAFVWSVLAFLRIARSKGWRQKRWPVLDRFKTWCTEVRGQRKLLAVLFPCFRYFFYLLAVPWIFFAPKPEGSTALFAIVGAVVIVLLISCCPKVLERCIRVIVFLVIPLAVYWGDQQLLYFEAGLAGERLVNGAYVLLFMLSVAISFFSTRLKGIWSTPLDFLMLVLLFTLPNIAGLSLHNQRLGAIGLKCLVLVVCFEVLLSEVRGRCEWIAALLAFSVAVYGVRAFI